MIWKIVGWAALGIVSGCVDTGTDEAPGADDDSEPEPSGESEPEPRGDDAADAATDAPAGPDTSDAIACPTPEDSLILDFTHNPAGDGIQASFGDFTETFSGGTFVYPNAEQTTMYALTSDVTGDNWHITGTVGDYSGFGLYFEQCTKFDASAFDGIQFTISGDVGMGTTVDLRVGTAANAVSHEWLHENGQPDEPPNFGRCIPPGTNQYDGSCSEPSFEVTVTDTPSVVTVLWDEFKGGSPEATVTPSELTSIAWTLPAPAGVGTEGVTTYSVDLVIDDIRFASE